MKTGTAVLALLVLALFPGCMIVRPGEVGYLQTLGKLSEKPKLAGARPYAPMFSKPVKINIRIVELYEELLVPSREGLAVNAELSLLYRVDPNRARDIYTTFGPAYEDVVVLSNLRATAREICARYEVKELYSTDRVKIEHAIADQLRNQIGQYGFVVETVLLRDIIMPKDILAAIESKVQAEQQALAMEFAVQRQRREAERQVIEAEGVRKAQETINQALTKDALQYRYIDALKALSMSQNSKVIVMDKDASMLIGNP